MPHPAEPAPRWAPERLLLRRASRPGALLSNLRFLLLAPRTGRGPAPFIPPQPRLPLPAVAASLLLHLALTAAVFLQRRAPAVERHLVFASEAVPIYWYGPPPRLGPPLSSRAPANFRALHPRAMVWFAPPRPTNRWQTLMEPAAPPEVPRWLPPAQNIVAWPRPQLPALAAAGHAVAPAHSPAAGAALPPLRDAVPQADRLQLGVALAPPPALAAPHARLSASAASASDTLPALLQKAAPGPPFIALSETPGPNPPPLGQAAAPVAIGPRVAPERPAAAPPAVAASWGPANLLVLLPAESAPPPPPAEAAAPATSSSATPPAPAPVFVPGPPPGRLPARDLLWLDRRASLPAGRPVGHLLVNMPNLTSAAGSWILKFFELAGRPLVAGHLEPPEPIRKVDPKYPPWLMEAGVEGDVLLDAVIEPDGRVRQIRILRGLHPELDRLAAEAFARWQFRPARMDGEPVELEVLAQIPFRAAHPPGPR
jgi:protein TonB